MGTWSLLDTVLAGLSVIGLVAGAFGLLRARSASPARRRAAGHDESKAELALKSAELADRLRIIHEHQAIVAHSLVGLVARIEGSAYSTAKDAESFARQNRLLVETARGALDDMRRAMTVALQGFDSVDVWPSLETIADLFAEVEEEGIVIDFEESGDRFPMAASAELAIYRILSEALDNARQHGGVGTEVDVVMVWDQHGVTIKVNDDGERARARRAASEGKPAPRKVTQQSDHAALVGQTTGRGILEMKSRAEAFGGTVMTQRVPGVGFALTAAFPMIRYATNPTSPSGSGS